jgi:hypothetical protein
VNLPCIDFIAFFSEMVWMPPSPQRRRNAPSGSVRVIRQNRRFPLHPLSDGHNYTFCKEKSPQARFAGDQPGKIERSRLISSDNAQLASDESATQADQECSRVVRHTRAIIFQLAEVTLTGAMARATLAETCQSPAPPLCA